MSDSERIRHLEEAVKHLILSKQEEELLADPFNNTISTLEEHHKKDQEHKTVFQKFLHWMTK